MQAAQMGMYIPLLVTSECLTTCISLSHIIVRYGSLIIALILFLAFKTSFQNQYTEKVVTYSATR